MIGTRNSGRGSFTPVDTVFGGLGFIAGLGAAVYGYTLFPSLALAIFVFAMVSYLVGRALPDVIIEPRKAQRVVYFALLPAVGTATLYASYLLWEGMWIAMFSGFVGGGVAQVLVGRVLSPKGRKEEAGEDLDRAGIRPEEWGEPGPDDFGYRSYLRGRLLRKDLPGEPLPKYRWYAEGKPHHHAAGDKNRDEK